MKRLVNGELVELLPSDSRVSRLADRWLIHTPEGTFSAVAIRRGDQILISYQGQQYVVEKETANRRKTGGAAASGELRAPMPGLIVDVLLTAGAKVEKGDKVLVLEAMKTQQAFTAPFAGTLSQVNVTKGQQVIDGELLAIVQES